MNLQMSETLTEPAALEIENLRVTYPDGTTAVEELSFSIEPGEFVAVLGPSGCGKSTLLQVLSGILRPSGGGGTIANVPLGAKDHGAMCIGYVFQDHRLLPWRTVRENIELVLSAAGVAKQEWEQRVSTYLNMLQLDGFADSWPLNMSGGQRQRVSIARAMALRPGIVLMDEPFSTLDEVTARTLRQRLTEVWEASPHTVLFVTHSVREAVYLADRILILSRGPATLLEDFRVPLDRPRVYEDPQVTEIESEIVERVMSPWGYDL